MKSALQFLALSLFITSCSLSSTDEDYQFEAEYKNERFTGRTQLQNFNSDSLFIRGVEGKDFMNGRFITVIVDNYVGIGTYKTSKYSFAFITGGDAIGSIAKAYEPYGEVVVQKINDNIVKGEFTGMFISRDSTETFEMTASFEVVRDFY